MTIRQAEPGGQVPETTVDAETRARAEVATGRSLAQQVGGFVAATGYRDLPEPVRERARHLILDAVGLAFASTGYPFAAVARDALTSLGSGEQPAFGMQERLQPRDAATMNGVLIHGLDFDDTHIPAVTHVSAAALPAALSAALSAGAGTDELLLAYVLGVEISARVGLGGGGRFHDVGFHPTGVAGTFGASVAASKIAGLGAESIATAQGIAGSMSAGLLEFLQDGAWTKRLHPGWAANSGLTAAAFAGAGWTGPAAVYEGRFGLYASHLHNRETHPELVGTDLGEEWELMRTAVKPYPVCHFIHAFADAALALRAEYGIDPRSVASITAAIHPTPGKVVCEPVDAKYAPRDDYDAKFSLPFVVAATMMRGRFTLTELDDASLADPAILDLARKVRVVDDPDSAYPRAYSGALEIELADGTHVRHRERVNRGHEERPLSNDEIVAKFHTTIGTVADAATAQRVHDAVMGLGGALSAADFAETCRAR